MTSTNGETRLAGRRTGPKCIAIVGPFASGKTTLMEAILERTGAIARQAPTGSGTTVGDHGTEARAHGMGIEATVATTQFMGESITFMDCPGSVEFCDEANGALAACDAAIVVAEADAPHKLPALQLVLRKLDGMEGAAHPFPQPDRQGQDRHPRNAAIVAAPERDAAAAAANSSERERHRRWCDRPGAGAGLHLPRTRREPGGRDPGRGKGARDRGAVLDAGAACRSRRQFDGGVAQRHRAAARPNFR